MTLRELAILKEESKKIARGNVREALEIAKIAIKWSK